MESQNNAALFDADYYEHGCGIPYKRDEHWLRFFGKIADRIMSDICPSSVLDAGCALGILVEALRNRGVEAYGVDISEYAINHVYQAIKPYCWVGSLTEPLPQKYDLLVCIEVMEHMAKHEAEKAIENICKYTDDILFSSSPFDYKEVTHFNIQPPEYWVEQFARQGFVRDVDFDASFITTWAVRFRRSREPLHRILRDQERRFWQLAKENADLRSLVTEIRNADQTEALQNRIQSLEQQASEQEQVIQSQEQVIQSQEQVIQSQEQVIGSIEQQLRTYELQWNHLQTTPGWALLQRLQRMRARVAPSGSTRDEALNSAFRGLHQLRVEGIRAVARQGYMKVTRRQFASPSSSPAATPIDAYQAWVAENEPSSRELQQQKTEALDFTYKPLISFITPVYNPPVHILRETIESVRSQTYTNWELCLADGNSTQPEIKTLLEEYAEHDNRIKVQFLAENQGISGNSNAALAMAQGEYIALLDHDDLISPTMLYEVVKRLNEDRAADLLYFDEDKVSEDGQLRSDPFFKPDWSQELLLSANYLMHSVIRRSLVEQVGGFNPEMDGTQDWDLAFRCTEQTTHIQHIPKVLYHWRQISGSTASVRHAKDWLFDRQLHCVENHMRRQGIDQAHASFPMPGFLRVQWPVSGKKVSIIIPTKDKLQYLQRCISSIVRLTVYKQYEIIIVDNASEEPETLRYFELLRRDPRIQIVSYREKFNYSQANNIGARYANGDMLLFLNNDVEILEQDWLEELVRWAELPDVGIVGAKLLFPDDTIQHAGVIIGMEGHASHIFAGSLERQSGPFGSPDWYRNYMAVTGACMMIRRDVFNEIGGFDEKYVIAFSDVEICLAARQAGYRVVYTPFARLRHYEGRSRANHIPTSDVAYGYDKMQQLVEAGDPYYNPNLSYNYRMPTYYRRNEESRGERLRRILNAVGVVKEPSSKDSRPDAPTRTLPGNNSLPYQQALASAGALGKVLHRDDIYGSGPPNNQIDREIFSIITRYAKSPVLDLGCGTGTYVAALQGKGISATGLEVSAEYVAKGKELKRNVELYDGIAIPYDDGSFDTVIAIEVLEHIPDWEKTLQEMLRVTRRCVIISVPNIGVIPAMSRHLVVPWHLLEATHVNFFSTDILANYLKNIPGITSQISTYGNFQINGETFQNHISVVIHKVSGASG